MDILKTCPLVQFLYLKFIEIEKKYIFIVVDHYIFDIQIWVIDSFFMKFFYCFTHSRRNFFSQKSVIKIITQSFSVLYFLCDQIRGI